MSRFALPYCNHAGHRIFFAVRDRHNQFSYPPLVRKTFRRSVQRQVRSATGEIRDLDIGPLDALGPTGPQRLQRRFFRRPSSSKVLSGGAVLATIARFLSRKDASDKDIIVFVKHLFDPLDFDDIGTQPEYAAGQAVAFLRLVGVRIHLFDPTGSLGSIQDLARLPSGAGGAITENLSNLVYVRSEFRASLSGFRKKRVRRFR